MSISIDVAATIVAIGSVGMQAANLRRSGKTRKGVESIERAVNHQPIDAPSLIQRVTTLELDQRQLKHLAAEHARKLTRVDDKVDAIYQAVAAGIAEQGEHNRRWNDE